MHSKKYEVRTFMPDFGNVNERRNQLHEVIRLSGLNVSINDTDHPLIVKVASLQPSRIQVYFIDNDDYFQKLDSDVDAVGSNREDNDERIIFFSRTTAETARKLQWEPAVMQVSGWIGSLVPLYIKKLFSGEESFKTTKIVYSILDEAPIAPLNPEMLRKMEEDGINSSDLEDFRSLPVDVKMLHKIGMANADAVIFNNRTPDSELVEYAQSLNLPVLMLDPEEENADKYHEFYQSLLA